MVSIFSVRVSVENEQKWEGGMLEIWEDLKKSGIAILEAETVH